MRRLSTKHKTTTARLPLAGLMVGTLLLLLFSSLVSANASAAVGDMSFSQRAGYVISKGDLSRDPSHLGHMFAATRVFNAPVSFLSIEPMHKFSLLVDSFYALGKDKLLFPLIPNAPVRLIEPSFSIDFCFLSAWAIRPCFGAGFTAVYLQSSIQNYQVYATIPAEARVVYASSGRIFFLEAGARYRAFKNRVEGFVAQHSDVMPFVGIGLFFTGR